MLVLPGRKPMSMNIIHGLECKTNKTLAVNYGTYKVSLSGNKIILTAKLSI